MVQLLQRTISLEKLNFLSNLQADTAHLIGYREQCTHFIESKTNMHKVQVIMPIPVQP